MREIGFSTGALAYADFRKGIRILVNKGIRAIELSALRQRELSPLIDSLDAIDLSSFAYVSVHAPSQLEDATEAETVQLMANITRRGWPIIVHPDVINDFALWSRFGKLLLIENMDKRKNTGRTASELLAILRKLPEALLCFDLGHARQVDPTMSEAVLILEMFVGRLGQLHVSEVNARSTHDPLTAAAILSYRRVSQLIPAGVPVILESPVTEDLVETEIALTRLALPTLLEDVSASNKIVLQPSFGLS